MSYPYILPTLSKVVKIPIDIFECIPKDISSHSYKYKPIHLEFLEMEAAGSAIFIVTIAHSPSTHLKCFYRIIVFFLIFSGHKVTTLLTHQFGVNFFSHDYAGRHL